MVNENLPVKFFVGMGVDEKAPDHVHTIARVNLIKDEKGKKEGKAPVDADAS